MLTHLPRFYTRYIHGSDEVKERIISFAAEKLVGTDVTKTENFKDSQMLACLSVRLALDFMPLRSGSSSKVELKQIEQHMRVCLCIDPNTGSVKSISSSEPLLAEAATAVMNLPSFNPITALSSEFRRPQIERSPRGEIVVALMQLLIRDETLVKSSTQEDLDKNNLFDFFTNTSQKRTMLIVDFLQGFFAARHKNTILQAAPSHVTKKDERSKLFSEVFKNSHCYFSHFVKLQSILMLTPSVLLALALRGASVLCANCMPGVDIITPFLFNGDELKEENISVILWQCKNDKTYGVNPTKDLFNAMTPQRVGLSGGGNIFPNPVIRIVTSLASQFPRTNEYPKKPICALRSLGDMETKAVNIKAHPYTSYDFWASGFGSELYPVLDKPGVPWSANDWSKLLDSSIADATFKCKAGIYTEVMINLRRQAAPGISLEGNHFKYLPEEIVVRGQEITRKKKKVMTSVGSTHK